MRAALVFAALLVLMPTAAAEFGRYDAYGYPLATDGSSTFPGGVLPGSVIPDGPLNEIGPFTVYPYYPVLTAEVQRLAREHPDLVKVHSIGKSTLGLEMWMLEIADFENPAMLPLEEREVVWVDGGTHSNEYSGVWFAAHLASFLADGYAANETAKWIVENRHTWIMPLTNPDGSHAFGRLNAHAVNVNRNYPVIWGALAEDPVLNNPGPSPASEIETQNNIVWFNETTPDLYVSVHCCGNLWLYPYGMEGLDPLDQLALSRICEEAFADVRDDCGPIWSTIYPASGSSVDTVYEYTGAAAFGYEMSGRNAISLWGQPFSSESIETEEIESWNGLMHGFLNVHRYGAYPNVTAAQIVDGKLVVRITNEGYGNLTNSSLTYTPFLAPEVDRPIVDYGPVEKAIPLLAPGASADITLDGPIGAGAFGFDITYVKRHMASPLGVQTVALALRDGPGGLEVLLPGAEPIVPLAIGEEVSVPGFSALAALAGIAIVVTMRRMR